MPPLLAPADFRPSTGGTAAHEALGRYTLTAAEANDTDLTATIARMSERVQQLTGDDYSAATETLVLSPLYPSQRLYLPKRCSAVAAIRTRAADGTLTAQANTPTVRWRATLSLDPTGAILQPVMDVVELIGLGPGLTNVVYDPWSWPVGSQTVEVDGTFGWTTAPGDILRALGMLVWNHYKPQRLDLGMTTRITVGGETQELDTEGATGIIEADGILRRYDRRPQVIVR